MVDPITALTLADGFLTLVEKLVPAIQAGVNGGQITPEQQQAQLDRISKIREGIAFQGPEWQPSEPPKP